MSFMPTDYDSYIQVDVGVDGFLDVRPVGFRIKDWSDTRHVIPAEGGGRKMMTGMPAVRCDLGHVETVKALYIVWARSL